MLLADSRHQLLICAGFAQWKAVLHLLLGCQEGPIQTHVHFFTQFLQALLDQVQHSLPQVSPEHPAAQPQALCDTATCSL